MTFLEKPRLNLVKTSTFFNYKILNDAFEELKKKNYNGALIKFRLASQFDKSYLKYVGVCNYKLRDYSNAYDCFKEYIKNEELLQNANDRDYSIISKEIKKLVANCENFLEVKDKLEFKTEVNLNKIHARQGFNQFDNIKVEINSKNKSQLTLWLNNEKKEYMFINQRILYFQVTEKGRYIIIYSENQILYSKEFSMTKKYKNRFITILNLNLELVCQRSLFDLGFLDIIIKEEKLEKIRINKKFSIQFTGHTDYAYYPSFDFSIVYNKVFICFRSKIVVFDLNLNKIIEIQNNQPRLFKISNEFVSNFRGVLREDINKKEAENLLELGKEYSFEDINNNFKNKIKTIHPDISKKNDSNQLTAKLIDARNLLINDRQIIQPKNTSLDWISFLFVNENYLIYGGYSGVVVGLDLKKINFNKKLINSNESSFLYFKTPVKEKIDKITQIILQKNKLLIYTDHKKINPWVIDTSFNLTSQIKLMEIEGFFNDKYN